MCACYVVAESTAYAAKSAQKKRNNTTKAKAAAAAVAAKTKAKTRKIGYNELSQLALSLSLLPPI